MTSDAMRALLERQCGKEETRTVMTALVDYQDYKANRMPLAGGLHDQPALWVQRCQVVDAAVGKWEREQADKRRRDMEARRRG